VTTPFFRDVVLVVEARHGIERPTRSPPRVNHGGKKLWARMAADASRDEARPS
jgi:hypothetical protein